MSECSEKKLCKSIQKYIQHDSTKGIVGWQMMNIKTLKPTRLIVGYKGGAKEKGVAFNFCPWCGGDLTKRFM